MSSVTSRRKRPGLLEVINKLSREVSEKKSEKVECDEVADSPPAVLQEKRRSSANRFHLAKSFAPPSSPPTSECSDDVGVAEKDGSEDLPKGPTQPMRCGVCGLRVYKSYRYICRSNAPMHLKNFFDPDTERFRVCKRCYSSKERCRQNLSLILLKSQTEQYTHLRSPLGTTHHRRSHSMKYLTRDIGRSLKRPYEDLICDETLDEDYLSDGDENLLVKATTKEPVSAKSLPSTNGVEKATGTGVVTVVRPVRNNYEVYPNHFTTYGEITKTTDEGKANAKTELTTIKIFNKKPEEKTPEENGENSSENANGELKSEIRTINYKLTLLDHAYALPAAKSVKFTKPTGKPPVIPAKVPKIIKTESLAKTAIKNMIKNNNLFKKKEPGTSSGENKDPGPARTCGIICSICSHLVTKSYSCYRRDNAPEKIRQYFTADMKVMKVCRRCVPYKKPKNEDSSSKPKSKVKISVNKFLKQKVKQAKKTVRLEAKQPPKPEVTTPTKDATKTAQKKEDGVAQKKEDGAIPKEEDSAAPKEDDSAKTELETPKEPSLVNMSPKQDTKMVHVSIKNGKVESSTTSDAMMNAFPPIGTARITDESQSEEITNYPQGEMIANIQLQSPSVVFLKLKGLDAVTNKPQTVSSVDFGTQPMQSMIGVKKTKPKADKTENESENTEEQAEENKTQNSENVEKKEGSSTESDGKENGSNEKDNTTIKEVESKVESETKQAKETEIEEALQKSMNEAAVSKPEPKLSKAIKVPLMEPVRSSPRRDKSIITPDKKKDTTSETKPTTVTTRKRRGISESESESKSDDKNTKQGDSVTDNKATSDDKTNDKTEVTIKRSTRKGRGTKRRDSESSNTSTVDDRKDSKKVKTDGDAKDGQPNHSYSTRYGQQPSLKCCSCNETVHKLIRHVQNGRSPSHLKPLFEKEGSNTLRICQKCLNGRSRVKSFL